MLSTITTAYLVPVLGILYMMFFIIYNPLYNKRQGTLFFVAALVNLLMIVATSCDFLLAEMGHGGYYIYRRMTSFLNFTCGCIPPILLSRIFVDRKRKLIYYIPAVINTVLCLISVFVPNVVFWISIQNTYGRGKFFFLPIAVSAFYILMLLWDPITKYQKGKAVERTFLTSIIGVLVIGMILEIAFQYKFVMWGASALGLLLYYLFSITNHFLSDPLTGVLNRAMYNKAISELDGRRSCTVISIDINDFKMINDTYGHSEGDRVLKDFAVVLSQEFSGSASVYRIGGDEFVIISTRLVYDKMCEILHGAYENAGQMNVKFAYGIVEYKGKGSLEEAIMQADKKMYINKADYYQEVGSV